MLNKELYARDNSGDVVLLKKISTGDTESLRKLYNLYSDYLFKIVFYILKNEADAEDTLQEIFMQIWEHSEKYDEKLGSPISWIVRVTRNKSIDKLRSKGYRERENQFEIEKFYNLSSDDPSENPDSVMTINSTSEQIKSAIDTLSDIQKDLLEFAYFRGFSQSELAEHFELPLGTVKTCIRSAMIKLRDKLKHLIN